MRGAQNMQLRSTQMDTSDATGAVSNLLCNSQTLNPKRKTLNQKPKTENPRPFLPTQPSLGGSTTTVEIRAGASCPNELPRWQNILPEGFKAPRTLLQRDWYLPSKEGSGVSIPGVSEGPRALIRAHQTLYP